MWSLIDICFMMLELYLENHFLNVSTFGIALKFFLQP